VPGVPAPVGAAARCTRPHEQATACRSCWMTVAAISGISTSWCEAATPRSTGAGQVRAVHARPPREMRHRPVGILAPGQVRARRFRPLTRIPPAPLRLPPRRGPSGLVIQRGRQRPGSHRPPSFGQANGNQVNTLGRPPEIITGGGQGAAEVRAGVDLVLQAACDAAATRHAPGDPAAASDGSWISGQGYKTSRLVIPEARIRTCGISPRAPPGLPRAAS
jgi:hypothetical protein